jgi:hypothetical protein
VSGTDLVNNLSDRPEACQLRTSLVLYMNSNRFSPGVQVKPKEMLGIVQ